MIRCVEKFCTKSNPRTGLLQDVIEYTCKDGSKGTEIKTYLNPKKTKFTLRNIKRDTFGKPLEIIDNPKGNIIEIYKPAALAPGVEKLSAGRVQCYYPGASLEKFINY